MKTNKSKLITASIIVTLATAPVLANEIFSATKNEFKVKVNNREVDIQGYNIEDYTYFKLRDIGKHLGFEVDFKDDTIIINNGQYQSEPKEIKKYKTFSILGDSYSTFEGFVEPSENKLWYPSNSKTPNDVKDFKDTWMSLFAQEYGAELVMNNSYSGSPVCYDGYGQGDTDAKESSYVKRVENLRDAELIIVEGATNDDWAGAQIGEYKYSDWDDADLTTFRPALAYVFDYIKKNHPDSDIVFMLNNGLSTDISESVETICEYYDIALLKLDNISKRSDHPNMQGMTEIKDQLIEFLNKGVSAGSSN